MSIIESKVVLVKDMEKDVGEFIENQNKLFCYHIGGGVELAGYLIRSEGGITRETNGLCKDCCDSYTEWSKLQ